MITNWNRGCRLGSRLDRLVFEKGQNFLNLVGWKFDLLPEDSLKLLDDNLTDDQLMFGKDQPNHVGAEPACSEAAHEDIGIEENPHDTALKISSSVSKPRASANGIALCRSCSKVIRANCRRSASRTTSLRLRFERRQNLSSMRSRSESSRMVTACFMSYNVVRTTGKSKMPRFAISRSFVLGISPA